MDVSHFDAGELKRSILNTIFQAVKAITGGITAINGQLIKGSGYAISAGGKVSVVGVILCCCCLSAYNIIHLNLNRVFELNYVH